MRTAFINQLVEEARKNDKIMLLVGDLGYHVVEPFADAFPQRFINVGIAEQNMIGVAVGLAKEGFIPFIYSIANFPTMRCVEQIRNDACYHDLNINIISVGGGFAYGSLGASHQATEELGMMRVLPNIIVCAPGDPIEAKLLTPLAVKQPHPFYIRLGKSGEPVVHQHLDVMTFGNMIPVIQGEKIAVVSTGTMLKYSYDFIKNNGINASLYSMPFIKPVNLEQLKSIAEKYSKIITIEEHQSAGGIGSVLLECLNDLRERKEIDSMPLIKRIAIPDSFYAVAGSQSYLRQLAGIVLKSEYFE